MGPCVRPLAASKHEICIQSTGSPSCSRSHDYLIFAASAVAPRSPEKRNAHPNNLFTSLCVVVIPAVALLRHLHHLRSAVGGFPSSAGFTVARLQTIKASRPELMQEIASSPPRMKWLLLALQRDVAK